MFTTQYMGEEKYRDFNLQVVIRMPNYYYSNDDGHALLSVGSGGGGDGVKFCNVEKHIDGHFSWR